MLAGFDLRGMINSESKMSFSGYQPTSEVETLLGDPTKAKEKLGWVPEITVQEMCAEMVAEDLKTAQRHALLKKLGYELPVAVEN